MDDCISFSRADVRDFKGEGENGIIITNPPYGERIGDEKAIRIIYDALGDFCRKNPCWSLFVITTDENAEEAIMGRKADRRRKLYNGRLKTCYYQFHGQKLL